MKPLSTSKKKTEQRKVTFKPSLEISKITSFVKNRVQVAGAKGVVLGISGGIDSAVVASLCVKAIGAEKVTGLLLFEDDSHDSQDYQDARNLAKNLGIKTLDFRLSPVIASISDALMTQLNSMTRLTLANIKARSRMIMLYAVANEKGLLVAGTGDRSEELLGYFTKFGDGAADIMPIAHLYKTEVRALGTFIRLPLNIVSKPSSPNLWKGQKASDELPAEYSILDPVLTTLFDEGREPRKTAELTGIPFVTINKVIKRNKSTQHKRELPGSLMSSVESVGRGWTA